MFSTCSTLFPAKSSKKHCLDFLPTPFHPAFRTHLLCSERNLLLQCDPSCLAELPALPSLRENCVLCLLFVLLTRYCAMAPLCNAVLVAGISLSQCQHLQPLLCSALGQSMPRSSIFYYALTFLCSPVFTAMAADLRPTQLVYPGVTGIARNYLDKSLLVSMVPRLLIKFFSVLAFIGFPAFDFNALSIKFYTNFACMQIL